MTELEKKIDDLKETVSDYHKEVVGYREEHQAHMEEIKPVVELLRSMAFGRKAIIWVTVLITSVGAAVLVIKKLF